MRPIQLTASTGRPQLGARLRARRQAQGMTIEQVAASANLSRGFLSRVERDATSPSVATLVALCEVLSLPIGSLFENADMQTVRLTNAPRINLGGHGATEWLVTPRDEPRVQVIRSHLTEGSDGGTELYTINCDVEVVHVLSGQLTVDFAGGSQTLDASDTLTFPGREPHTWRNTAQGTTEVTWTLIPAAWSGSS
jgi:transcriptional regulator with XRE-family HTH domain